jgi:hypothetical protein
MLGNFHLIVKFICKSGSAFCFVQGPACKRRKVLSRTHLFYLLAQGGTVALYQELVSCSPIFAIGV